MPTDRQIKAYYREFEKLRRQADRFDDGTVRRIFQILRDTRDRVAGRLISATGFELAFLNQLQQIVNEAMGEFERRSNDALGRDTVQAFDLGVEMIDFPIRSMGGQNDLAVLPSISGDVLEKQLARGAQFITNISQETANKINAQILLGLTAEQSPQEVIREIGGSINRGIFKTAKDRAEVIVRTEINSAINRATTERFKQVASEVPGMKKYWMHAGDTTNPHARGRHIALWRSTDPGQGGRPIPMHRKFNVNGTLADGPHDPSLPGSETINCRCRLGTYIEDSQLAEERELSLFG